MKRSCLVLLVCLLFTLASFAQQNAADVPPGREDVERYLDAMHSREMMKDMFAAMAKTLHQMNHEKVAKTPNLPPGAEERLNKMTDSIFADFPTEKYLDLMIPVFQKHYTKNDLESVIAFYSTSAGQKMLKEMPGVMTDAMKASTTLIHDTAANAEQRVQDEIAQLQKENNKDSKTGTPPSSN
jgi:hypothetical protein